MVDGSQVARIAVSEKLVVALDKQTVPEARALVSKLGTHVRVYKVGLELLFGDGLEFARQLKEEGKLVFLDMKILDIPNTVEKAVANIARMGFDFLTVHAVDKKTVAAAVRGRDRGDDRSKADRLKLLGVTVLTSSVREDLGQQGTNLSAQELAVRRACFSCEGGFDGVIASGHEVRDIRLATNKNFIIKVPGIRPRGFSSSDQRRVMTPIEALTAGADYLVVGRPIIDASDPVIAAREIIEEIRGYCS